jgi:hypothetical protein
LKSAPSGRSIIVIRFGMGKTSSKMLVRMVDRATGRSRRAVRAPARTRADEELRGPSASGRLLPHLPETDATVIAARQG